MAKGSRGAARHRADKPPPTRILGERPTPTRETAPTRPRPGALRLRRLDNVSHRWGEARRGGMLGHAGQERHGGALGNGGTAQLAAGEVREGSSGRGGN
jgi:hypothetical protein